MSDFKIKCIGTYADDFTVDKVYGVNDGVLCDDAGFDWDNDGMGFTNVESVNEYFSPLDIFHTKFKEVK